MSKGYDYFLDKKILRQDLKTGEVSTTNFKSFAGIIRFLGGRKGTVEVFRKTEDTLIVRTKVLKEEETLLYFKRKMRKVDGDGKTNTLSGKGAK